MFWFFNRKKKEENHRWTSLNISLSKSFDNIKGDLEQVRTVISTNKDELQQNMAQINARLNYLEGKIEGVTKISLQQGKKTGKNDSGEEEVDVFNPIWEDLTNLQRSMLIKLAILQKESSQSWINMKFLTQELYPNKDYSSVRSMISNYTDILEDRGLIKKKRKGRETFITLTIKGDKQIKIANKIELKT